MKKLGPSLNKQPGMDKVLELFSPNRLWTSALAFPLLRSTQPDVIQTTERELKGGRLTALLKQNRVLEEGLKGDGKDEENVEEEEEGEWCYDPAFVLPLFADLLAPGIIEIIILKLLLYLFLSSNYEV